MNPAMVNRVIGLWEHLATQQVIRQIRHSEHVNIPSQAFATAIGSDHASSASAVEVALDEKTAEPQIPGKRTSVVVYIGRPHDIAPGIRGTLGKDPLDHLENCLRRNR